MMDVITFERTYRMGETPHQSVVAIVSDPPTSKDELFGRRIFVSLTYDFNPWIRKLDRLRDLADGWDGYSSPAPSAGAIVTAKAYLANLSGTVTEAPRLAPSVAGGVGITHKKMGRRVYVEFFNDGDVCALFSDGVTGPRSRQIKPGYESFKRLSEEIREYLDA